MSKLKPQGDKIHFLLTLPQGDKIHFLLTLPSYVMHLPFNGRRRIGSNLTLQIHIKLQHLSKPLPSKNDKNQKKLAYLNYACSVVYRTGYMWGFHVQGASKNSLLRRATSSNEKCVVTPDIILIMFLLWKLFKYIYYTYIKSLTTTPSV